MADVARMNLTTFERRLTARGYRNARALQAPEAVIFAQIRAEFAGRRILDIGVGGGRTTPHLLDISSRYLGIDYSPKMIGECRKRFPGVEFRVCDARDLAAFGDGSFDLVVFSFNGIDCVGHCDRLKILAEVRRVLADGGVFVFSSHNRGCPLTGPWSLSNLFQCVSPFASPLHFARRLLMYPLGIVNYYRRAKYQEESEEYAIVNDGAHEFGLLQYYIRPDAQMRQLQRHGFRDVRVVGLDGRCVDLSGRAPHPEDAWLYYVCRR